MPREEQLGKKLKESFHRQPITKDSLIIFSRDIAQREDVDKADEERAEGKYDTSHWADPKNKKYPLGNDEEIRAAWEYIHHPHDASEYSPEDVKTIEARIAAAWRKHISKEGPPEAEKK